MSTETSQMNNIPSMEGLNQTLEIELVEATRERVVMRMPVTLRHRQPWGFLHGGASLASLPLIERANFAHFTPHIQIWCIDVAC